MAFLTHIIYIALKVVMTNTPQCWELVGNDFKYKLNIIEMSQAHQLGAAFARHNFTTAACTARQGNAELGAPIYVSVNRDTFDHMLEYVRGHDTEPTIAGVDPLSVQRQQQAWRKMFPDVADKFPVTAELTRVAKRAKKTHGPFLLVKVVSPLVYQAALESAKLGFFALQVTMTCGAAPNELTGKDKMLLQDTQFDVVFKGDPAPKRSSTVCTAAAKVYLRPCNPFDDADCASDELDTFVQKGAYTRARQTSHCLYLPLDAGGGAVEEDQHPQFTPTDMQAALQDSTGIAIEKCRVHKRSLVIDLKWPDTTSFGTANSRRR